ncbi:glycoside hydrolase family 15 protein [Ramlibacter sp. G-1-2-2]|uniref:Glycoside hydrolase family 15 protein n=1 Tax=Ramlibacter agri TaxID=2728837 RepID=A0A848H420_9BURK|nr:glycoside hydrolase family 15 protein [Ramlibacter agri]NML43960.1 glycoside hydrolase family 15 protein [Ramlibacter agri]
MHGLPARRAAAAIGDHAAIGNCRTLALVSRQGAMDWWCYPAFASPSVFAALLDDERGGCFALGPPGAPFGVQAYEPNSNILRTRFETPTGVLELIDFMCVPEAGGAPAPGQPQEVVRIAECTAGSVDLECLFAPRPDYARADPMLQAGPEGSWRFRIGPEQAVLRSSMPMQLDAAGPTLVGSVRMQAGDRHAFILHAPADDVHHAPAALVHDAEDRLAATQGLWQAWCARCRYEGPYADAVERSALALKLLNHRPTGAVVAAPTTSLPESETGGRNWDYRFCWLRDTSLVLDAFLDLGYTRESDAFLRWLLHATHSTRPGLQVVYDVSGDALLPEEVLTSLRGYRGIGPVRIGNAASEQVQHDIYGEVLMTAWHHVLGGGPLDEQEKALLAGFTDVVCEVWRKPDQGIWEVRLPPRHNTHSKLMCWAALDRALALHDRCGLPIDEKRVRAERDALRADIDAHAFDATLGSYVGFYGSQDADASLLLIPRIGYLEPNDPRMVGTVREVMRQLRVDDGLLYRYPPGGAYDGVPGPEHLFAICSFWCVECLALQGRVDEARDLFERLLKLRNHVGLYAEEFSASDGSPMGNFPQAFSHTGLITAALALKKAGA